MLTNTPVLGHVLTHTYNGVSLSLEESADRREKLSEAHIVFARLGFDRKLGDYQAC